MAISDGGELTPLATEEMATWQAGGPEQLQTTAPGGTLTISPVWNDAKMA